MKKLLTMSIDDLEKLLKLLIVYESSIHFTFEFAEVFAQLLRLNELFLKIDRHLKGGE